VTAFLVDRTTRLRMTFTGEKAKESLGGLVTNDVVALTPGHGHRAAALTAKGRVIALVRVFDRGADLLLDCEPESAEGFVSMIRKYVNPRTAKFAVITDTTACLGVHGAEAAAALAPLVGIEASVISALPPLGIVTSPDGAFDVIRSTELSVPGFEVVAARDAMTTLRSALEAAGIQEITESEVEIARVEVGLPRYGVDMDAETIPQEANLDTLGAISFTKGCYTGQEVVARIHFRGHVNKHLRFLSTAEPLTRGAIVLDASGKDVGEVRSAVVSPRRGPLALAMVRREVEIGSEVQVRDGERTLSARVEAIA
jgi:folate-binding protein YgfZ